MESSRFYARRIGWNSPNCPGGGKWTYNSFAPTFFVIGPDLRTSTAKLTAFTDRCALARHSLSFAGTTASVFWRRATLASHAQSGFDDTATRCSPREPTFGTRVTMACGGLEKSARVRRRIEYTWSDFWTSWGRSSFLSFGRATRPQRGPYEVLGASRSTNPAHSLGGSNVTHMNLEARPWLVDFHATAAFDNFPFFGLFSLGCFCCIVLFEAWGFLHGLFLVFPEF